MQKRWAIISLNFLIFALILALLFLLSGPVLYWLHKSPTLLNTRIIDQIKLAINKNQATRIYAKTNQTTLQVLENGKWQPFFVKGVNIGTALPGKWFTEFPNDEKIYLNWLEKIGQMNANCIRIYTLLPPEFYNALKSYNDSHPDTPLWLLQEIWPEENPTGKDYLEKDYVEAYFQEIEYGVDAIHGQAYIAPRKGRAYGIYTSDISKYLLAYLVGRELEPDEVITTNHNNSGFSYKGEYFSSTAAASPCEAWLAMNCDYLAKYEEEHYASLHPVAIVSWPTLDVKEHDSEWNKLGKKSLEYNDKVSIDINNISCESKMKAGFLGAYHIYPNYPDFMNNESKYNDYQDEQGRLRYGGYLQEFMEGHNKYPALVAEFGLATGMGTAHLSPDGLNHGGLTEEQQGKGIVRMMQAIKKEGYAGAIIFEWLDEWAKKTWTTEPFMIPYERHVLWHNAIDPEQNYGLLAIEPQSSKAPPVIKRGNGQIKSITLNYDARFLYLKLDLFKKPDFSKEKLLIALDTYNREKGEFRFDPAINISAPSGAEFLLDFSGPQSARMLVHPGYNASQNRFSSYASSQGLFEEIRPLISRDRVDKNGNPIAALYENASQLNYGTFDSNSYNHWYFADSTLYIRLPWGRLNFSDPSSLMVLNDSNPAEEASRDTLGTQKTDGIIISALYYDFDNQQVIDLLSSDLYKWEQWELPAYSERLKKSYFIIQEYFKNI